MSAATRALDPRRWGADAVAHGLDRRGLGALSFAHMSVDLSQGLVPALLPFLIDRRGLSYSQAGALVLVLTMTSSLIQPLFGHLADRASLRWLAPSGVLLSAGGVVVLALADSYGVLLVAVAFGGLGVGAFHPEAARYANYAGGGRRATGMSLFSVGGNAGFALAPAIATPLVLALGISGAALVACVPIVAGLTLVATLPRLARLRAERSLAPQADADGEAPRDRWGPFLRVAGIAASRSGVYFGLQTFLPVFVIVHMGGSTSDGNATLTVLLAAGAVGTLVGGRVADRIGRRPVMIACMAALTPLVLLLIVSGRITAFPVAALLGFVCVGNFAITVVLGQELLPHRLGVASGVTLGAAMGSGGVIAAALGPLADGAGLVPVMLVLAALPLAGLALSISLPETGSHREPEGPRDLATGGGM